MFVPVRSGSVAQAADCFVIEPSCALRDPWLRWCGVVLSLRLSLVLKSVVFWHVSTRQAGCPVPGFATSLDTAVPSWPPTMALLGHSVSAPVESGCL